MCPKHAVKNPTWFNGESAADQSLNRHCSSCLFFLFVTGSVFFFVSFLLFVYLFQRILIPANLFICFLLWWSLFHMGRDIPATSIFASAKVSVANNPKHILGTLIPGDWCSSELFGYRWRYKNSREYSWRNYFLKFLHHS